MKKNASLSVLETLSFDEVLFRRRSVRGYLADEVPADVLRDVFGLAQRAPSNCNVQPWIVHVVSGDARHDLRDKLLAAARCPEKLNPDWPVDIRFEGVFREHQFDAAAQLYGALGVERQDMAGRNDAYLRNFAFFDAPHVAFIFMPLPFDVRPATDCGMYAQTLMLAMVSRGIDSCAQGALTLYPAWCANTSASRRRIGCCWAFPLATKTPARRPMPPAWAGARCPSAVQFHR